MIEDDDLNRSRCSTQPWWQVVQQAWNECPLFPLPKRDKPLPDYKKYVDQTMGLMLSLGARLGNPEDVSLQDITQAMAHHWGTTHIDQWEDIMRAKRQKLEILWASLPEPNPEANRSQPDENL